MRVLVLTDDLVGPAMAGSALRAWELARVLLAADHEVVLSAATGSSHPEGHGPPVVNKAPWRWADAVLAPPWCLPPRAFVGRHVLVIDGATPRSRLPGARWLPSRRIALAGAWTLAAFVLTAAFIQPENVAAGATAPLVLRPGESFTYPLQEG